MRLALERENIEARPVWKPMHLQPVFECRGDGGAGPGRADDSSRDDAAGPRSAWLGRKVRARAVGGRTSEEIFARGLCLPSGSAMGREELERVTGVVRRVARRA